MPASNGAPLPYDYLRGPEGVHEILSVLPERHDDWWEVTIMVGNLLCHVRVTEFRDGLWDATDVWGHPYSPADLILGRGDLYMGDPATGPLIPLGTLDRALIEGSTKQAPYPLPQPGRLIPYLSLSWNVIVAFALGVAIVLWAIPAVLRWL